MITHCTIRGSTSIPGGMVLVSIIIDIERIGDYSKNIYQLARQHPGNGSSKENQSCSPGFS